MTTKIMSTMLDGRNAFIVSFVLMVIAGYVHYVYGQVVYGGKEVGHTGATAYLVAVGAVLWLSSKGRISQRVTLVSIAIATAVIIPGFIYDGAVSHLYLIILWLAGDVKVIDVMSQFSGLAELVFAIPLVYYTYRLIRRSRTMSVSKNVLMCERWSLCRQE
jgi:hypothetical protein